MHQTTITLAQAQQRIRQRQQDVLAEKRARLLAFREFKTSFCDLMDAADWQYYAEATGLQQQTLARFARYQDGGAPVERVYALAPGQAYYEPLNVASGQQVACAFQATIARPHLLRYLQQHNPEWQFRAAASCTLVNAA